METRLFSDKEADLEEAAKLIQEGKTVIFPTETVYGLGANALDAEAVKNIFIAKGRPSDNPLIVHIDSVDRITDFVEEFTDIAKKLANAYWPGPMTIILPKKKVIPDVVSAGLDTVGIRIPESKTARDFLKFCGLPVAAPSANLSGSPSPTTYQHVIDDMNGRVDGIIEGEDCKVGVESTVIDATGSIPVILRPGGITPEMIKAVCGDVIIDKGVNGVSATERPKSPGMKYKHYAPKAEVILIEKNNPEEIAEEMIKTAKSIDDKIVFLCTVQTEKFVKDSGYKYIAFADREKPETLARGLFKMFRECDDLGYDTIILEGIEEKGIGLAFMNRAHRAAHK